VKKVVTEQTIDDFMESSYYAIYPWGGEDALLQLRDRIPDFIEYLNTQV